MNMNVSEVRVVERDDWPDTVFMTTDKPDPLFPRRYLTLQFEILRGTGTAYVKENFPGVPCFVTASGRSKEVKGER